MVWLRTIRNTRGMGTLVPVMGVGVLIAVSFVLAQQYFMARAANFRRDLNAAKLLNVVENLSRNVVFAGYEEANRRAYKLFNDDWSQPEAGCSGTAMNTCCNTIPGLSALDGDLHLRRGPTGLFGCWPNPNKHGTPLFCEGGVTRVYRFGNATAAGAQTAGTWGCFPAGADDSKVCVPDPQDNTKRYCALYDQNKVSLLESAEDLSVWERIASYSFQMIDQQFGTMLNNYDPPMLIPTARAVTGRTISGVGNDSQVSVPTPSASITLKTVTTIPSLGTAASLAQNQPGRHLVQRCYFPEQCSEFWFCIASGVTPGANAGNGRCFRQTLDLAPNLQVGGRGNPLGGGNLTGLQICSLIDQSANDVSGAFQTDVIQGGNNNDDLFACVKTSTGNCADPVPDTEYAFCAQVCHGGGNTDAAPNANCKAVQ